MADTDHVKETYPVEPVLRDGESSFKGKNNQLIIMGRDRPSTINSGYGTGPGAGSIHIVVGRKQQDPSLRDDSAFVYTTMKTDVDQNLGVSLKGGRSSYEDKTGAAVIVKSDNVRLVHRTDGDIRISSDDGDSFIILSKGGCEIKIGSSWLSITKDSITIEGGTINLGKGASSEKVVLGNSFMNLYNNHQHQSPVGPTSNPLTPMIEAQHLSKKSIVE